MASGCGAALWLDAAEYEWVDTVGVGIGVVVFCCCSSCLGGAVSADSSAFVSLFSTTTSSFSSPTFASTSSASSISSSTSSFTSDCGSNPSWASLSHSRNLMNGARNDRSSTVTWAIGLDTS